MRNGITITDAQLEAIKNDHTAHRIRVLVGEIEIWPLSISCSCSEDYQQWSVKFKNSSSSISEGAGAGLDATIQWSIDGNTWLDVMTGFISTDGVTRSQGYITADYLSLTVVDKTQIKGTGITPTTTAYAGYSVCNPYDTATSIVHLLGGLMGITSFDVGDLSSYVKDVFTLGENTVWEELQHLAETFDADLAYTNEGKLYFHSPLESGYTEKTYDWTLVAKPNATRPARYSDIIGTIERKYLAVTCNKAKCTFSKYTQEDAESVIYKDTTNYDSDTGKCSITVAAGATYPTDGVLSLDYKDPDTGDDYPYATGIITPTVGENMGYDIGYSGGTLELVSFDGSTEDTEREAGASQIILKNTGSVSCTIFKLTLRGTPYKKDSDVEVTEKDSDITEDVDYVTKEINGDYATSSDQIDTVLSRYVAKGKIRHRQFSFSTLFLPFIQRGEVMHLILDDGTESDWEIVTYEHQMQGKQISTMRTSMVLKEVTSFTPTTLKTIKQTNPSGSLQKGTGISSTAITYQVGSSGTTVPTGTWLASIPTVPAGSYLWTRTILTYTDGTTSTSYTVSYASVSGTNGEDAKAVIVSASELYWHYTGRGILVNASQTISLTASLSNITATGYQWYKYNTDTSTWDAISGATTAIYAVPSEGTGSFRLVVTDASGTITSNTVTIGTIADGKSEGMYLGVLTTAGDAASWTAAYGGYKVPSGKFSGQNLVEGDYYVYDDSGTVTNYYFNGSSWETASGDKLSLFTNAFWDVMSLGTTQPSGSFYTLWAKYFMAMEAVIVSLGASRIHLQTLDGKSGCVYGGSYNADGTCSDTSEAGFWLGESGDFKVNNISATGILSLKDSNGDTVFENTLEKNGARISLGTLANDSFRVGDFTGGAGIGNTAMAVTKNGEALFGGVYDGNDILLATLTPPHTAAADFGRDASIDYTRQFSGGWGVTNT